MDARITTLTRRAKGGIGRKEDRVSAEAIRIGRASGNEIYLPDPRVPLQLALLHHSADGLFIEALGAVDLRVNGAIVRAAQLKVGDTVGIGPYDLVVEEAPDGIDAAVTVELTQPLGDDLEELRKRSRLSIAETGLGKRKAAWVLSLLVVLLFVAAPLLWPLVAGDERAEGMVQTDHSGSGSVMAEGRKMSFDISWKTGEMMDAHKFFADDCGACHTKPFVMVEDAACATCHVNQHGHAELEKAHATGITETRCASCHAEHNGPRQLRAENQVLCASCHADLDGRLSETALVNASDFGKNHPQFKATVWTDPAAGKTQRVSLDEGPAETSNLKFPHKTHMDPKKMKDPKTGQPTQLACQSCHVPEAGGALMQPVEMETHCAECHRLTFDKDTPDRAVSHGLPKQVYREVSEFYAARALKGGVDAPEAPGVVRRRPGTPLQEEERKEALAWANEKADWAARYLFSKSQCGSCHVLTNEGGRPEELSVQPVKVAKVWFPKARFDHKAHRDVDCGSCHGAAESLESKDVLQPKIAVRRDCHGGQAATDRVPSTCVTCHDFHIGTMPPMHPAGKVAVK